jgi:tRNA1Val (adenine37-N6)-methyltransferase
MNDITVDTVFEGRLRVKQMRKGYRFSVDAVLLAHFAGPLAEETVLDLGAGCGIISLILASCYGKVFVHGVELQSELADIAVQNAADNGLSDRVRIHAVDMKQVSPSLTSGPVDLVVCNPPFHPVGNGRLNPDSQRAVARHELGITLSELVETAGRMLRPGGRFAAVYPAGRLEDMLREMRRQGLAPEKLRPVHPKENGPAKLFLVAGVKAGEIVLEMLPPLILYDASGACTPEAAAMLESAGGGG